VHAETDGEPAIQKALTVMSFCGTVDPQARRYQIILESFHEVLTAEAAKKSEEQGTRGEHEDRNVFSVLFGVEDASLAAGVAVETDAQTWGSDAPLTRHGMRDQGAET
jgi:hypothetical protein